MSTPASHSSTDPGSGALDGDVRQLVTFLVDGEAFAFPIETVQEIVRPPQTVRVPLTPPALLGLANLRGAVLPILDTRPLMGLPTAEATDSSRVVVADCGTKVGLLVDRVDRVRSATAADIIDAAEVNTTVNAALLAGVIRGRDSGELVQLLNLERTISSEFQTMVEDLSASVSVAAAFEREERAVGGSRSSDDELVQMVSFLVDNQEYALPVLEVAEIVRVPDSIRAVPGARSHVLGLVSLRDRLLPLVDIRRMFGLESAEASDRQRVVVVQLGGSSGITVGLVVDAVREVLQVARSAMDPLPAVLQSDDDQGEITAVCRLDEGQRLLSVLSAPALFDHPEVQSALAVAEAETGEVRTLGDETMSQSDGETQVVVFRLDAEEYGADISAVAEIIRVPEALTRVPKTPEFIEGLVNLRGGVLPVMDMRSHFGLERLPRSDRQRILVLDLDGVRTGFIVDAVTEVLRVPDGRIEVPPRMSEAQQRIIPRVANFADAGRMVMLLDVTQLIDEDEAAALGRIQ